MVQDGGTASSGDVARITVLVVDDHSMVAESFWPPMSS
jgi:hypothetical protein